MIVLIQHRAMPSPCSDGIGTERSHAPTVHVERHGIVVVPTDGVIGVFLQPTEALDRLRPIVHHVAAKGHGVTLRFGRKHRLRGGQVTVDVRDNEESHGDRIPASSASPNPAH